MTEGNVPDIGIMCLLQASYLNFPRCQPGVRQMMANCGHRVFVSPQAVRFLTKHTRGKGSYTMCDICVAFDETPEDDRQSLAIPGTSEVLQKVLGVEEAAAFQDWMQQTGITELDPEDDP